MSSLDVNRVRQALVAARIHSFSSDLIALQSCRNEDELYSLLLRAFEGEPFLLSRVVRVANSVMYVGRNSSFVSSADACLMRIGLAMGKQIAEDFLIDQALGRVVRANRFARGVWREARLAGGFASLFRARCAPPFDMGGPGLPIIMSYLGELFMMGLAKDERDLPSICVPCVEGDEFDLVELSLLALKQMQLPEPIEQALRAMSELGRPAQQTPQIRTASAILLCRWLAKQEMLNVSFTAAINESARACAIADLGLSEEDLEDIISDAKRLMRLI